MQVIWLDPVPTNLYQCSTAKSRTDSGRLFQRDGAQVWKTVAPVLDLTLGTDKLSSLFDFSEREGIDAASME